jgi:hypothetical protein
MWLTELLPTQGGSCPTCPTYENKSRTEKSVAAVSPSDLSDLSDPKNVVAQSAEGKGNIHTIFTQVDPNDPLSVRLLPIGGGKLSAPLPESSTLPSWIRPHIPGEVLDDTKERRCVSARCGAVLMRQEESDTSWSYKRYCCAACYSGQPSMPVEVTNENSH